MSTSAAAGLAGPARVGSPTTWNGRRWAAPRRVGWRVRTLIRATACAAERNVDDLGRDQEAERLVRVLGDDPQPGRRVAPVADLEGVLAAPATGRGDGRELGLQPGDLTDLEVALGDGAAAGVDLRPHADAERAACPPGAPGPDGRREHDDRGRLLLGVDGERRRGSPPPTASGSSRRRRRSSPRRSCPGCVTVSVTVACPPGSTASRVGVQPEDRVGHAYPALVTVRPRHGRCPERRLRPVQGGLPDRAAGLPERAVRLPAAGPARCRPARRQTRERDPRGGLGAARADRARGDRDAGRRGGLRRAHQGLGGPAQRAHDRRLPLRHPRGPAPPRARPAQRVRRRAGSSPGTCRRGTSSCPTW